MTKQNSWRHSLWARTYKARIIAGLEYCRNCKIGYLPEAGRYLTFAHLIARYKGGTGNMDNISILCERCNKRQDTRYWPTLFSLAAEERAAPASRQWARIAAQRVNALNDLSGGSKRWNVDLDDELILLEEAVNYKLGAKNASM